MKVCLVHNVYGKFSGEEAVVDNVSRLLAERGHELLQFARSSAEIPEMRFGEIRGFFSGIYSFSSKKAMRRLLAECRPDIVHVHNVFPLISPSVLGECRMAGVPVVMTVHNYRLICPNGLFLRDGKICEECSGGREWRCVLHNCETSMPKSLGYALRNWVARVRRAFLDNVTTYVTLTEFQRRRLIQERFPADRIHVIPNMIASNGFKVNGALGHYVGFVGRVSPEKGISLLLRAAEMNPGMPFKIAGGYERAAELVKTAPPNVQFVGHLGQPALNRFYEGCRIVVLPSLCYETFGLSLAEAGTRRRPVICSRIGGLPEIVDDDETGLLFEPGNGEDLAEKIRSLWDRPELCRRMGRAGREKALREYSPAKYYERLMALYDRAIQLGPPKRTCEPSRTLNGKAKAEYSRC